MTSGSSALPCPQDELLHAAQLAETDEAAALALIGDLLRRHPGDARLRFLQGSLHAAAGRYDAAEEELARAVEADPGFAIARFQLGLLQLTSGFAERAIGVWRPLQDLAVQHPLRLFATGLEHMSADRFQLAKELLEQGIAANQDNPALSRDMAMLIDEMSRQPSSNPAPSESFASSTQLLLNTLNMGRTKH